jgi:hypothetical protein
MLCRVVSYKLTDVSELFAATLSQFLPDYRANIPEGSHLHTRSIENLKDLNSSCFQRSFLTKTVYAFLLACARDGQEK